MTARGTMQWMTLGAVFSAFLFSIFVGVHAVRAANGVGNASNKYGLYGVFSDDTQKNRYIAGTQVGSTESNQLLTTTIGNVINTILTFIGVIFFILMLAAGVLWMTSRGNEEKTTQAVQIIYAAIVGIIIVFGSYALTKFIFRVSSTTQKIETGVCNVPTNSFCDGKKLGESCGGSNVCSVFAQNAQGISCACYPAAAPASNGPAIAVCTTKASITSDCATFHFTTECNQIVPDLNRSLCQWDDALNKCLPKVDCPNLNDQDCYINRDSCDLNYVVAPPASTDSGCAFTPVAIDCPNKTTPEECSSNICTWDTQRNGCYAKVNCPYLDQTACLANNLICRPD